MTSPLSSIRFDENHPSPNYTERRGQATPKILVMHYTACPTNEALNTLTSTVSQVSAHYLIPPDGEKVYRLVDEKNRAWHAGAGHWDGIDDVNSYSIGIENVGWGYTYGPVPDEPSTVSARNAWSKAIHARRRLGESGKLSPDQKQWQPFPKEQMELLKRLSKEIIERHSIDPEKVVGHSDVAPQRKVDPGPLFDWEDLAKNGIGVWYDKNVDKVHSNQPTAISIPWMQSSLKEWGYKVPQNGKLDQETKKVVTAFQMHFRPKNYDGTIDEETSNILDALLCQRRNKADAR